MGVSGMQQAVTRGEVFFKTCESKGAQLVAPPLALMNNRAVSWAGI